MNNRFQISKKLEDKISLSKLLKGSDIAFPKSYSIDFSINQNDVELLLKSYFQDKKFVVQKDRSHTGNATFFCTIDTFDDAYHRLKGEKVKVSEFLPGITFTINGCIAKNKVFFSAPQVQITGLDYLTPSSGSSVGNDFSLGHSLLNKYHLENKLYNFTHKVGNLLQSHGLRGLFGLDIQLHENEFYLIEVNARQTANVAFQTHLELLQGQTPLELIDICQWLDIDVRFEQDRFYYLEGSQIFLRSFENLKIVEQQIKPGLYRLRSDRSVHDSISRKARYEEMVSMIIIDEDGDKPMVWDQEALTILDVKNPQGVLFFPQLKGSVKNMFDELFRIQSVSSLCEIRNDKIIPKSWVKEVLTTVKEML